MSIIVQAKAHLHPVGCTKSLLRVTRGRPGPVPMEQVLANATAIDSLARLLTEAIETRRSKDGRIDMRDVAAHVLAQMAHNQR